MSEHVDPLARNLLDTPKSWQALQDYAAMGPGRSLRILAEQYRIQSVDRSYTERPPTTRLPTLASWSVDGNWQFRVAAYDEAVAAAGRSAREAALAKRRAAWIERHMDADELLALMADQARGSMGDFLHIERVQYHPRHPMPDPTEDDPDHVRWVEDPEPVEKLIVATDLELARDQGVLHLVKKYTDGRDGIKLELYSAHDARVKIGEHHGLFGKQPDILKYIDLSKLDGPQLERIAAGEDPVHVLIGKPDSITGAR